VRVGETQMSRMYRARWLANYARSREEGARLLARGSGAEPTVVLSLDDTQADMSSIIAKIRKIVARIGAEANAATGKSYVVRTRLRVHCRAKYVIAKRKPPSPAMPALMQSVLAAGEPTIVKTVKVCAFKFRRSRRLVDRVNSKRSFSVTLPYLDLTSSEQSDTHGR